MKIGIIGSYNVGLFLAGSRIPGTGETVIGHQFYEGGGGKGSNQALAAALFGADVSFMGRVGTDGYGRDALAMYQRLGVSTDRILLDPTIHSGISVIMVDEAGNNSIMVVPGANDHLSPADIDAAEDWLKTCDWVGFQLENPQKTVLHGIRAAFALGKRVLLDPAPACPLPESIYPCLTCIKPNEHEASILTGIPVTDAASALEAGRWFRRKGVQHSLITLGGNGAVLVDADGEAVYRAPEVDMPIVDTTGAGDCFSGALLAELATGRTFRQAILHALCAATLSATRKGVVEALPSPREADSLLAKQKKSLLIAREVTAE